MKTMSMKELYKHIKETDNVDWIQISRIQKLSEPFIREFANKLNWYYISQYQRLSEPFIREFANKVNWERISIYQKLSEGFIREFAHKVDWFWISICQRLSEPFIKEFANSVDWERISIYQKLSEGFIREFADKLPPNFDRVIANEFRCGLFKRQIHIHESNPTIIHMGCFRGTKTEALAAVDGKYSGKVAADYKRKIRACFKQIVR